MTSSLQTKLLICLYSGGIVPTIKHIWLQVLPVARGCVSMTQSFTVSVKEQIFHLCCVHENQLNSKNGVIHTLNHTKAATKPGLYSNDRVRVRPTGCGG